jgi:hypothetical protein
VHRTRRTGDKAPLGAVVPEVATVSLQVVSEGEARGLAFPSLVASGSESPFPARHLGTFLTVFP